LLARIDPRQFELALMQASGQRQRDEAQLGSAKVTLQRFKTLLDQDSIARQEVDSQAALVKQLEGTVVIDKAAEGTARLNLGYTRIVAPVSGRIGLRTVDVGNVVSNSDANGIATLTQVTPIDVVFSVPQEQASELQQLANSGALMKVTALDRTRSSVLDTGAFSALDNQIDTTTGTVKAKARFANNQMALFPSQFVNVRLLLKTIEGAVVVPVTALRHGSMGDYVYVLNAAERSVSLRPVQRGQATLEKIVIASGLQAGERVITEGADRLKDGARVVLPGDAPKGAGAKRQGQSAGAGAPGAPASSPQRRRRASQAEGS
jgi:multidrug efflux system membrane fusion protein